MKKIIALSASNTKNSINQTLLSFIQPSFEGFDVTTLSVRDFPLTMYGIDEETDNGFPDSVKELRAVFATADAFVIATPEHNGSMPAVFKNTIDWLSRMATREEPIFFNKPVLLLSTSPGENGGATNLATLTQLMPWWGASSASSFSLGSYYNKVQEGQLVSVESERLNQVAQDFIKTV